MQPNLTHIEYLRDTEDIGHTAAVMVGRCDATGLDPDAYRGLIGAAVTLGERSVAGPPWDSDRDLLTALSDLETELTRRAASIRAYMQRIEEMREHDTATHGAHGFETAAYDHATEALAAALTRVEHALRRVQAVPETLGDTYAAAYALTARGRVLPHDGRWITGEAGANIAGLTDHGAADDRHGGEDVDDVDRWIKGALDAEIAGMDAAFDFAAGLADVYTRAGRAHPEHPTTREEAPKVPAGEDEPVSARDAAADCPIYTLRVRSKTGSYIGDSWPEQAFRVYGDEDLRARLDQVMNHPDAEATFHLEGDGPAERVFVSTLPWDDRKRPTLPATDLRVGDMTAHAGGACTCDDPEQPWRVEQVDRNDHGTTVTWRHSACGVLADPLPCSNDCPIPVEAPWALPVPPYSKCARCGGAWRASNLQELPGATHNPVCPQCARIHADLAEDRQEPYERRVTFARRLPSNKTHFVSQPNGLPGEGYDAGNGLIAVKSESPGGGWGLVTATGWQVVNPNAETERTSNKPGRQHGPFLRTRQEAFQLADRLGRLVPWHKVTRANRDKHIGDDQRQKIGETFDTWRREVSANPDSNRSEATAICPRCDRPAVGWPLHRGDRCSPKDWVQCIRDPHIVMRELADDSRLEK